MAGVAVEATSRPAPLQAAVQQAASQATGLAEELFMSKFGNLSVGGGGAETDTVAEAGRDSGEGDDLKAWMQSVLSACKKAR